jgi:hypothetical protein
MNVVSFAAFRFAILEIYKESFDNLFYHAKGMDFPEMRAVKVVIRRPSGIVSSKATDERVF